MARTWLPTPTQPLPAVVAVYRDTGALAELVLRAVNPGVTLVPVDLPAADVTPWRRLRLVS